MRFTFNQDSLLSVLDWSYTTAVQGIPGLGSVEEFAQSYTKRAGTVHDHARALIFWHTTTAATSGFVAGLGGVLTLPVAIPANIASVMLIQLRMIAAIAHMGGYDIRDDQVKSLCYVCLCGNAAKDVLKGIGINAGSKVATHVIEQIPFAVIKTINQAVGFRLLTKFGQKGVINLGKAIPIVGGVVGGTFDGYGTRAVGKVACRVFLS